MEIFEVNRGNGVTELIPDYLVKTPEQKSEQKKRRTRKQTRNIVLCMITVAAFLTFFITVAIMITPIPTVRFLVLFILFVLSWIWIISFFAANGAFNDGERKRL